MHLTEEELTADAESRDQYGGPSAGSSSCGRSTRGRRPKFAGDRLNFVVHFEPGDGIQADVLSTLFYWNLQTASSSSKSTGRRYFWHNDVTMITTPTFFLPPPKTLCFHQRWFVFVYLLAGLRKTYSTHFRKIRWNGGTFL